MGDEEEKSAATRDLLLSELSTFEESIWRSEDTGEKRFNFFITLVTAIAAGLVALWSADSLKNEIKTALPTINLVASATLLLFGLVTYLRMRHRDRVTDEYKRTTRYVRDHYHRIFFEHAPAAMKEFRVPVGLEQSSLESFLKEKAGRLAPSLLKLLKGGYTVSLAALNGVLLFITLMLARVHCAVAIAGGLLLAALLVFAAAEKAKDKKKE